MAERTNAQINVDGRDNARCLSDLEQKVRLRLAENPQAMTMQLANELEVPEVQIIRVWPDNRSVELDVTRWQEIMERLPEFGKVHVIISNGAATVEVNGEFGGYSTWGDFFNVQTATLDMHIRYKNLSAVFAVEKPSHMSGIKTISLQFFDNNGNAALKVFFSFGNKEPSAKVTELFQRLRADFRLA